MLRKKITLNSNIQVTHVFMVERTNSAYMPAFYSLEWKKGVFQTVCQIKHAEGSYQLDRYNTNLTPGEFAV